MIRPQEKRRATRRKAGFTLTEMMVVVAIISITAGLAAPSIYGTFAENRIASAPLDLVRSVRRARSEAQAFGRAHLVRFNATVPGMFTVYRGVSSSCSANNWPVIIAWRACGVAGTHCIDQLDMADSYYSHGSLDIRVTEAGGNALVDMCFEPHGRTLLRNAVGGVFNDQNVVNGGVVFNFRRFQSGAAVGVMRRVVVPLGGDARVMR